MKSRRVPWIAVFVLLAGGALAQNEEEEEPKKPRREIATYFTPDARLLPAISAAIQKSKETLDIAMYSLSIETVRVVKPERPRLRGKSEEDKARLRREFEEAMDRYEAYRERVERGQISIYDALAEAVDRGVRVRMVFNEGHRGEWKTFQSEQLKAIGIDLRYTTRTMHEKFGIIDGKVLVTGSANWSSSAAMVYNESALFFRGYPDLVGKFQGEFDLIWERSHPYPPQAERSDSERDAEDGENPAEKPRTGEADGK